MLVSSEFINVRSKPVAPATGDPVLRELRRQLSISPYAAIRKIRCDFHEGVVILRGRLPTFYTRQVAQALVMKVAGVEELDDRIVVADHAVRRP